MHTHSPASAGPVPAMTMAPESHRRPPRRPNRQELRRSRLLQRIYERWDHRATLVVGGAGFGKTTLLAQALDENRLAARGDDLWLGCRPGDVEVLTLARGMAAVLEVDLPVTSGPAATDTEALATVLAHGMWRRAPHHVCLILDDLHHVPPGGSAASLLGALLDHLPTNGHLVLASRQEPPVELARHEVQGQVLRITEEDLAFDPSELVMFASLRGVPADHLDGVGGWPALTELRALGHPGQEDDFLVEEILRGLTEDQRRTLATAAALGGCDPELFAEVTGRDVDLAALVDRVPLVSCDQDGWFTIHPIWASQLASSLDPSERAEVQRLAGKALLPRDFHAAMDLLLAAGDTGEIEEALRKTCRAHRLPASTEGLKELYERLPATVRDGGLGELLAGMTAAAHDLRDGVAHVERALQQCRREGDETGIHLAVEYLSVCYQWMEEPDRLRCLWRAIVDALPDEDKGLSALADALVADTSGDPHGVLAALRTLEGAELARHWTVAIAWMRATARLVLGFPEAAREDVEAALEGTGALLRGAMSMRLVEVLFLTHQQEKAFDTLDRMLRQRMELGIAHTCCLGHSQAATLHALVGRVDVARQHAHRASLYAGPDPIPSAAAAVAGAQAVVALAMGDEEEAARLFGEQRRSRRDSVEGGCRRYNELRHLALLYVLEPENRRRLDTAEVGPCYALARDLGRALAAVRDDGDLGPATRLSAEHWATAPAFLPLSWQAELAVAAAAGGSAEGQKLATELSSVTRPALRRMAESRRSPSTLRRWALTLLDVPALPRVPIHIGVLGPVRLRRDDHPVDHPHWRRQRVRALLLYLVAQRGGAREEIASTLWPDLDAAAAARNLRVTLSYLLAVLEPDRADGEPSCFISTEAASIRLVSHDWLSVDAWEMERLIDRAHEAERSGEPSTALRHLREAVALYRGPFLAEVGYEAWALPHRDRLAVRFVASAVHAGELTLAAGDHDEALRLASRALEVERYSEPAHRLTIAAHLAHGDVAAAHRALATCRRLLDELGVRASEELQILERSLRAPPRTVGGRHRHPPAEP